MIQLENIQFSYKRNCVFHDFNLNISDKENIISILGHNGAGKTTLLKILEGSIKPKKGKVKSSYAYKDIFILSEKGNMYEDMSINNNLSFLRLLKKKQYKTLNIDNRIKNLIMKFSLEKHMDKKFSDLSSGLKTRANLLAGLIYDPELILLDEPTNTIDPATKKILTDIIKELSTTGKQIIIVTHDLEFCYEISNINLILNEGTIINKEILDREKLSLDGFKKQYLKYTEEGFHNEGSFI
jgi:ABC-type multidrug transport system ATPase subunit